MQNFIHNNLQYTVNCTLLLDYGKILLYYNEPIYIQFSLV